MALVIAGAVGLGGPRTISITYVPATTRATLRWEAVAGAGQYGLVPLIPRTATITTTDTFATVETGGQLFCALVVAFPANEISDAICGLSNTRIPAGSGGAPSAGLAAARRARNPL